MRFGFKSFLEKTHKAPLEPDKGHELSFLPFFMFEISTLNLFYKRFDDNKRRFHEQSCCSFGFCLIEGGGPANLFGTFSLVHFWSIK